MKGNVYALKLERKPFADEYNSKGQRLPIFAVRKATGKTPAQAYMRASPFFKKNYKISSFITLKRVGEQ